MIENSRRRRPPCSRRSCDQPSLREPLGLGVERGVGDRPEVADAARHAVLELVWGGLAELEQPEDDDGGGRKVHIGRSMIECPHDALPEPTARLGRRARAPRRALARARRAGPPHRRRAGRAARPRLRGPHARGSCRRSSATFPPPSSPRAAAPALAAPPRPRPTFIAVNLLLIVIWAGDRRRLLLADLAAARLGLGLIGPSARLERYIGAVRGHADPQVAQGARASRGSG